MANRLPLSDHDGEVRELTEEDFRKARPFSSLPESLRNKLSELKTRGPQKAPTKVPTTIRFDADVLAALKASGKGWQTRVNEAVREWLKSHRLRDSGHRAGVPRRDASRPSVGVVVAGLR